MPCLPDDCAKSWRNVLELLLRIFQRDQFHAPPRPFREAYANVKTSVKLFHKL